MNATALSSGHVFARGSVVAVTPLREQSLAEAFPELKYPSSAFRFVFDVAGVGFRVTITPPDNAGWWGRFSRFHKYGETMAVALTPDEEKSKAEAEAMKASERVKAEALRAEALQMLGELDAFAQWFAEWELTLPQDARSAFPR